MNSVKVFSFLHWFRLCRLVPCVSLKSTTDLSESGILQCFETPCQTVRAVSIPSFYFHKKKPHLLQFPPTPYTPRSISAYFRAPTHNVLLGSSVNSTPRYSPCATGRGTFEVFSLSFHTRC